MSHVERSHRFLFQRETSMHRTCFELSGFCLTHGGYDVVARDRIKSGSSFPPIASPLVHEHTLHASQTKPQRCCTVSSRSVKVQQQECMQTRARSQTLPLLTLCPLPFLQQQQHPQATGYCHEACALQSAGQAWAT